MSKADGHILTTRINPLPEVITEPNGSFSTPRSNSDSSGIKNAVRGSTLSYHHLNFSVQETGKCCCGGSTKQILHNLELVTLYAE
jgi:hypothetical protein